MSGIRRGLITAGIAILVPTVGAAADATGFRFERGRGIQLIDARGELLEWPDSRDIVFSYPGNQAGLRWSGTSLYFESAGFDVLSPEPLGVVSLWPRERPATVRSWIKASHHLALGDDGMLYELGSMGYLFGRQTPYQVPPLAIPFPPGVSAWTRFAAGGILRLAISDQGELWAWQSHTTHNGLRTTGGTQPTDPFGLIVATAGTNWVERVDQGEGLIMYRLAPPPRGALFQEIAFTSIFAPTLPAEQGGAAPPPPNAQPGMPFIALSSDGELYRYGFKNTRWVHTQGIDRYYVGWTNGVFKVARPAGVREWNYFSTSEDVLLAISDDDRLYASGSNHFGQLGIGSTVTPEGFLPVVLPLGVTRWTRLEAGARQSFALGDNRQLYGWGELSFVRTVIDGTPDAEHSNSDFAFIKTRPTRLNLGSIDDPVVDFAMNSSSLVILFSSGRVTTFSRIAGFPEHISFDTLALPLGTIAPTVNRPPFCRLRSPNLLSRWESTNSFKVYADAVDLDGTIESVTLLSNGQEVGAMTFDRGLHVFEWKTLARNRYELSVKATDNTGLTTTSTPVVVYLERDLPSIGRPQLNSAGVFSMRVFGSEPSPAQVEWSNDLRDWYPLQSVPLDGNFLGEPIQDGQPASKKFYRVAVDEPE